LQGPQSINHYFYSGLINKDYYRSTKVLTADGSPEQKSLQLVLKWS